MKRATWLLLVFFSSCNTHDEKQTAPASGTVSSKDPAIIVSDTPSNIRHISKSADSNRTSIIISKSVSKNDTTIDPFSIDNESSEGGEGTLYIFRNNLFRVEVTLYGERGRSQLSYHIDQDKVLATAIDYLYDTAISAVRGSKDMKIVHNSRFSMDTTGNIVSGNSEDARYWASLYKKIISQFRRQQTR